MAIFQAIVPVASGLTASNFVDNFDERSTFRAILRLFFFSIFDSRFPELDKLESRYEVK